MPNQAANHWDEVYRREPPWEIGKPQPAFVDLDLEGPVLDVGCGTGENALYFAAQGLEVVGIDISPVAIESARRKAAEREVEATFEVADFFEYEAAPFASVIDCGTLHCVLDRRTEYVERLTRLAGGRYFLLCFSEFALMRGMQLTKPEIRDLFGECDIREVGYELMDRSAPAWFVEVSYA